MEGRRGIREESLGRERERNLEESFSRKNGIGEYRIIIFYFARSFVGKGEGNILMKAAPIDARSFARGEEGL